MRQQLNLHIAMSSTLNIIGREQECQLLDNFARSGKPEFIVVYGRRRVGKTYLVNRFFDEQFTFKFTGLAVRNRTAQLAAFHAALNQQSKVAFPQPSNWLEAFDALKSLITLDRHKRKVVFIDELPFMDTPRGGLLVALEHFWNDWGCTRPDLMLIVCGSATAWVTQKIIKNHGGLHNRLTGQIYLRPFTLAECKAYIESRHLGYDERAIAECYMIMGGIPFYLSLLERGKSLAQNIDELFFLRKGKLANEFDNLYASLFDAPDGYLLVVEALSNKNKGLTRKEIIEETHLPDSGDLTRILRDLETCDIVRHYRGYGKTERSARYQLTDFYTFFYFKFLRRHAGSDKPVWTHLQNSPKYHAWSGYAFEQLCLYHYRQIERKLGIEGMMTEAFSWTSERKDGTGAQIDLVIKRADRMVNVCEMKYWDAQFTLTKAYEQQLRERMARFREECGIRGAVTLVMVTTYGVRDAATHSIIWNEVMLPDLFASI